MPLTDARCRRGNHGNRPYKVSDGAGLFLLVQTNGAKLWRLAYRFGGRQKTLALGAYPRISLHDARRARDEAKRLLFEGKDPSVQRRHEKLKQRLSAATTFRAVADEWLAKLNREGRAAVTVAKKKWLLDLVERDIGARAIADITPPEVLAALRKIEARGHYETAGRARATIGAVCRYAIATGRAVQDPTQPLRGALTTPKVTHYPAIVDPTALGGLLRAIDGYQGAPQVMAALRLLPRLFCRPGELRFAEWTEFDLDAGVWSVPASRMKMRRPHRVPLAKQVIAILRTLNTVTGEGRLAFPSLSSWDRPISENTLNGALRRLGYLSNEIVTHGFRSTAATRLNEMLRWHPDVIERALAHQEPNSVRRAYTSAVEYWPERLEMMQVWSDYLDELKASSRLAA